MSGRRAETVAASVTKAIAYANILPYVPQERQRATEQQVEELTERVSVLHRENEVLELALQVARNRSVEVQDASFSA